MMYGEFVEGTGCKLNDHNYQVFKHLEILYMNSDVTKAEIYEMGKKLVDNSKSEEEIRLEKQIKAEIEEWKAEIERYKWFIKDNEYYADYWKEQGDKEMVAFYKNPIKSWKEEIRICKRKINELKWVLG